MPLRCRYVTTINRVAKELGESEDWLFNVANEMDCEHGVIWVYGDAEDSVMAFTDFGIENLIDLIKMHKGDPTIIERWNARQSAHRGSRGMDRPTEAGGAAPSTSWRLQARRAAQ